MILCSESWNHSPIKPNTCRRVSKSCLLSSDAFFSTNTIPIFFLDYLHLNWQYFFSLLLLTYFNNRSFYFINLPFFFWAVSHVFQYQKGYTEWWIYWCLLMIIHSYMLFAIDTNKIYQRYVYAVWWILLLPLSVSWLLTLYVPFAHKALWSSAA